MEDKRIMGAEIIIFSVKDAENYQKQFEEE